MVLFLEEQVLLQALEVIFLFPGGLALLLLQIWRPDNIRFYGSLRT
jgi:hypothetical protein